MKYDPNKEPPKSRLPTEDDVFADELRERCARALTRYFKEINVMRPIRTLTKDELLGLAEACTAEWIVGMSEKIATKPESVSKKYVNLLMG